jgi:hypothetical protein
MMRKGVANGVIILPLRDFEVPSEWHYIERSSKLRVWINYVWHNVRTKFNQFPSSNYLVMKIVRTDISLEGDGLGRVRSGWIGLGQ